jgi:thiol-disulfide isomerase/thioredoxin
LLIKDVAAEFGPSVRVVIEEYGNSEMAQRYGVRRYPVVFVDDVLVARPKDFGFAGSEDTSRGRYVPWSESQNQARFKDDLRRFINLHLKGERADGFNPAEVTAASEDADGPSILPSLEMRDLSGRTLTVEQLRGRPVVVEMWATWCPPCRSTLSWLGGLARSHGDRLTIVAIAVDSKEDEVRRLVGELQPTYHVVLGTPDLAQAFGTVAAVPKLFVFDGSGRRAGVVYGAPPDLHRRIEDTLATLNK